MGLQVNLTGSCITDLQDTCIKEMEFARVAAETSKYNYSNGLLKGTQQILFNIPHLKVHCTVDEITFFNT